MRHLDHWAQRLLAEPVGNEPTVMGVHSVEAGLYGALGVHKPVELGAFAVLTPWIVVPTITEATLFVTDFEDRVVDICTLSETVDGVFHGWSRADWGVEDDGTVTAGIPIPGLSPSDAITYAVVSALAARKDGEFWSDNINFDTAAAISKNLMDFYLR
jgi:hypothetical protein